MAVSGRFVGILVALVAVAIAGVEALDRPEAAVEASVRRYATAVTNADLNAAMAEIAPDQRAAWSDWVQGQLGNVYDVTGIAVRAPALLATPTEVTVFLDLNRGYPDEFYQPTARVPVEEVDGQWYLGAPLLAPSGGQRVVYSL
jgi:hypothetical protein